MIVEIRAGRETFAADIALMRFLSRMDAPVSIERTRRAESFSADVTYVGFFASVGPHVTFEQWWPIERFATHFTRQKGPFTVAARNRTEDIHPWLQNTQ